MWNALAILILEMENWYTAESPYEDNTEGSMELPGFLLQVRWPHMSYLRSFNSS